MQQTASHRPSLQSLVELQQHAQPALSMNCTCAGRPHAGGLLHQFLQLVLEAGHLLATANRPGDQQRRLGQSLTLETITSAFLSSEARRTGL